MKPSGKRTLIRHLICIIAALLLSGNGLPQHHTVQQKPRVTDLTPSEKQWIKAHPVIRLGIDPGFAPFEFIGIPADIRDKIFEPFFTTKKAGEGAGLGLDVVNKIVTRHEGTITVNTETDKGSEFIASIPIP